MSNDKSCLVDATAIVLEDFHEIQPWDKPTWREQLVYDIGHDGSERGYHSQEIQDELLGMGIAMTRHERVPCMQLPGGAVIEVWEREEANDRFLEFFQDTPHGVLVVQGQRAHHAWAKVDNKLIDPSTRRQLTVPSPEEQKLDKVIFYGFHTTDW